MQRFIISASLITAALAFGGCSSSQQTSETKAPSSSDTSGMHAEHHAAHEAHEADMHMATSAVAVIHATEGNQIEGVVHFEQLEDGVRVRANLHNLMPNSMHGFHIHEHGDCSAPDGTSAGGHYNPEGHDHAGPHDDMRHAGDLGNIESDSGGNAMLDLTVDNITLNGDMNPIVGRGVIVHAGTDDLMSQPTGAAGPRIGCGVIELSAPSE